MPIINVTTRSAYDIYLNITFSMYLLQTNKIFFYTPLAYFENHEIVKAKPLINGKNPECDPEHKKIYPICFFCHAPHTFPVKWQTYTYLNPKRWTYSEIDVPLIR